MMNRAWRAALLGGLLLLSGCVSDELVSYPDHPFSDQAKREYLGEYTVVRWPGEVKAESARIRLDEGVLRFEYKQGGKPVSLKLVLSHVPGSRKQLFVAAIPKQTENARANLFFLGRTVKDRTELWAVLGNSDVAKGKLPFRQGQAKAAEVVEFLRAHGDAFVDANAAIAILERGAEE